MEKDLEQHFVHRFTPRTFSKEDRKEYERKISEQLDGCRNSGRIIIQELRPESSIEFIQNTNEEDDYLG